jgi:glycosyltransferase involved in cell wall biosynthesis
MEKKVIVFLKAYNAEKTLQRAIDSVLAQTHENFTLYILNNGSTDLTNKIILENLENDERIIHLKTALNHIINDRPIIRAIVYETTADFISYIDADDIYEKTYLSDMIELADEYNPDFVCCGYKKVREIDNIVTFTKSLEKNILVEEENYFNEYINYRGFLSYNWNKLYSIDFMRRKFARKSDYRFDYEQLDDTISSTDNISLTKRFVICGKPLYNYYQSDTMYSLTSKENLFGYWKSLMRYYAKQERFLDFAFEQTLDKKLYDFKYAIFLSLLQEYMWYLKNKKLELFLNPETAEAILSNETLQYITENDNFHEEFHILKEKEKIIGDFKTLIIEFTKSVEIS